MRPPPSESVPAPICSTENRKAAWAAFLSLTFVGGGAQCLHRFWEARERFFLICGLAASACGAALGCWYLLQDPGTGPSLGRLAAFALQLLL